MKKIQLFIAVFIGALLMNTAVYAQDWSSFIKPTVTVNNKAGNHQGVALYTQLCKANGFTGIEDFVQNCCLTMAQTIYYTVGEANTHNLRNISYELTDGGSLSAKGGSPPNIFITFDVNHIVTYANQYGNNAAITEVLGVLCHELTHGYQKEPKNCGQYDGNSEFFGEIEGLADLGRLLTGGFKPERFPSTGGSWKQGYTTTAFFYLWLSRTQASNEANFIRDLNLTAKNMSTWSHEAMCQQLFGKSAQTLWNTYQTQVNAYPWTNTQTVTADFSVNNSTVEIGSTVAFTNKSTNATSYQWTFQGGTPSNSTQANPTVTYNTAGSYTAKLVASKGSESSTKSITITVSQGTGSLTDITNLGGQITAQYTDSPTNEGIAKLIDNSSSSKYLTFHSSSWVQYYLSTPYTITQYTLTSANDAAERDPLNWTLKGSNDGSSWTTLDSRSNENFASRNLKRSFTFTNTQAFKYHRLEMTNNSGTILQVAELELFGTEGTSGNPPVASFTTSATTITAGQSVTFTDNSQNATSRSWSFNGGSPATSTQQQVSVAYSTAGTYDAVLTVSNQYGQNSKTVRITVNAGTQPVASFTTSATTITVGGNITFTDNSQNATSRSWTFNGGSPASSTQQQVSVTYNTTGTFDAVLTATNQFGQNSKTVRITVNPETPQLTDITNLGGQITAQYSDSPTNEVIAKLIDNSSNTKFLTFHNAAWVQYYLASPYIVSQYTLTSANDAAERDPLNWTLKGSNDGTSWTSLDSRTNEDFASRYLKRSFSFTNTQAFKYHRLEMTNNSGTILQIAELELFGTEGTGGEAPVASFTTSATSITVGQSVTFTDNSQNATSRSWSFNGGSPASSTQQQVSVTYSTAGTYDAVLTVSNQFGQNSKTVRITVNAGTLPIASFTTSATSINIGGNVTFTDNSQNATSRSWSFAGGSPQTSTQQQVTVTYNAAGTFDAVLTVSNQYGQNSKTVRITVIEETPEVTDITNLNGQITAQYNDSPTNEGTANLIDNSSNSKFLTFNNAAWVQYYLSTPYIVTQYTITSANDAAERDPLKWTLKGSNNGTSWATLDSRSNEDFATRYLKRSFTFQNTLAYKYHRLEMTNNSGTILQVAELELFGIPGQISNLPVASFTTSSTTIAVGQSVTFTDNSDNATSRSWSFAGGNPSSSTQQSLSVAYNTAGTFNATLTVSNTYGQDSETVQITVQSQDDWNGFIYPTVVLVNAAPNHAGSTKYKQLVQQQGYSTIEDWVKHCCLVVAKELYYTVTEANAHGLRQITYKLNDGGSLSYKGGSVPNIEVGFDLNHVVTYSQQYGDNITKDEIYGVLCHELTHGYQKEPRNCGQYDGNSEFFGFIEGTADLGRLLTGGFNPVRRPSTGGSYLQGYTTTAFFYLWMAQTKDSEFLKKLNITAKNYSTWSLTAATQEILGRTASSLWTEYQGQVPYYPWASQVIEPIVLSDNNVLNNFEDEELRAYPNPFVDELTLSIPNFNTKTTVTIYSVTGQVILKREATSNKLNVNTSDFSNGLYIISVDNGSTVKSLRLIKQ